MARSVKPTLDVLHRMAGHVKYEIRMYRETFAKWRSLNQEDPSWNPTLESALLHFRVLREFFLTLSAPGHQDDVIAADYVTQLHWNPPDMPVLQATKEEIDKRLAHLSTRRLKTTVWQRGKMEYAMESLIAQFKQSLQEPEANWYSDVAVNPTRIEVSSDISNSTVS